MDLTDYLQEKLKISEEDAKQIVEAFHAYKKEYGHPHHSHEKQDFSKNNSIDLKQVDTSIYQELENKHCDGCPSNCNLSAPGCGRGQKLQEQILKETKDK